MLRRPKPGSLSSPKTAARPEFNGMHPERIKELQNEGEEQAEQQVRQPPAPFGQGSMLDEEPDEAGNELNTMPMMKPPAGLKHKNVPHPQLPNMAAASRGHIPAAHASSGAMNRHPKRGKSQGSLLYGD